MAIESRLTRKRSFEEGEEISEFDANAEKDLLDHVNEEKEIKSPKSKLKKVTKTMHSEKELVFGNRQNMSVKMKVSKDLKQKMSLSINAKLFPMNKNGQLVFR